MKLLWKTNVIDWIHMGGIVLVFCGGVYMEESPIPAAVLFALGGLCCLIREVKE